MGVSAACLPLTVSDVLPGSRGQHQAGTAPAERGQGREWGLRAGTGALAVLQLAEGAAPELRHAVALCLSLPCLTGTSSGPTLRPGCSGGEHGARPAQRVREASTQGELEQRRGWQGHTVFHDSLDSDQH